MECLHASCILAFSLNKCIPIIHGPIDHPYIIWNILSFLITTLKLRGEMTSMVIIFKFEMIITDEKGDIQAYVHQHPHLFQSSVSAINFDIVDIILKLEEDINRGQHHENPHLFQSPISAINICIVDHIFHRINGRLKDHHLMVFTHQDISVDHYSYAHPPQRPHRSSLTPLEIAFESENEFGDSSQHLCGHLPHLEASRSHVRQSSVAAINFCVVEHSLQCIRGESRHLQPARVHLLQHHQLHQHLGHLHHGVQYQQELSVQQHQTSSTSRREKQQIKSRIIIEVIIKEKKVDIMEKNDRKIIRSSCKTIPGIQFTS